MRLPQKLYLGEPAELWVGWGMLGLQFKIIFLGGCMSKDSLVFENKDSKRRVTIQLRMYNQDGVYEEKKTEEKLSLQVKNASESEVMQVIKNALEEKFGSETNE